MGWNGSSNTRGQVRLEFKSAEAAIAWAERHGHEFTVTRPNERGVRPKAYADNFAWGRAQPWTH